MILLQQIIQLLSEPPGSTIYHLATLFALQVIFAISLSQWRRRREDLVAGRMTWAAGFIFLARLGLMFAGLFVKDDPITAVSLLPPLEYAIHTATAVLIVWAIGPTLTRWPRLGNAIALLLLVTVSIMYLSFALAWSEQASQGAVTYSNSLQATIWSIFQLAILGVGVLLTFTRRPLWFSLRQVTILLLLVAHIAHFGNVLNISAINTNIAYWIRLGYLVVFPLWAAMAYFHTLGSLLSQHSALQAGSSLTNTLQAAAQVIRSLQTAETVTAAIWFVSRLTPAPFIGIATLDQTHSQQLRLTSNLPQTQKDQPRSWNLNLGDWPGLRLAVEEKRPIELLPNGLGARQLREWYEEMGMAPQGALLIQPLLVQSIPVGLLIVAAPEGANRWTETNKTLLVALADYIAQTVENSLTYARAVKEAASAPLFTDPTEEGTAVTGRLLALEEERKQLRAELETTQSRLQQAEIRAVEAGKQARDLAATLDELDKVNRDEQIDVLKAEVAALRESLINAEEAMALASAGEGGLSPEWVMTTISRYSGQLEEAQARMQYLEAELNRRGRRELDEVMVSLIQELRTPMTSIVGYTDLLLAETMGILGVKQRDFLQRVKARTEQMETLLAQLVQLATYHDNVPSTNEQVNVQEVIETAVDTVITQLREKNLRLDLDIGHNLPLLPIGRKALHQIMTNLLANACQASTGNGRISLQAHVNTLIPRPSANGHSDKIDFFQLDVTDSGGGILVDDLPRVFEPHHRADDPLIAGLGDTGAGLSVARTLVEANGGRVWVQSQMGQGSTFFVLFPVPTAEPQASEWYGAG